LWWVIGGTLGFLACVLYIPGLRGLFGFAYLHATDVLLAIAAGATGIVWFELFKWVKGTRLKRPAA
jgi:Ca2+-transporting ATPase